MDMRTRTELNNKANMNMEVLAQHWNEDFNTIKKYFYNAVDEHDMLPHDKFIMALYLETEKEVADILKD